jgi:hypothetical protein
LWKRFETGQKKAIIECMKMTPPTVSEIAARGERIYQEKLRTELEPAHNGQIAVINIETAEYELDADHATALKRAWTRWPTGVFFSKRVGFDTIAHIGGRFSRVSE